MRGLVGALQFLLASALPTGCLEGVPDLVLCRGKLGGIVGVISILRATMFVAVRVTGPMPQLAYICMQKQGIDDTPIHPGDDVGLKHIVVVVIVPLVVHGFIVFEHVYELVEILDIRLTARPFRFR